MTGFKQNPFGGLEEKSLILFVCFVLAPCSFEKLESPRSDCFSTDGAFSLGKVLQGTEETRNIGDHALYLIK